MKVTADCLTRYRAVHNSGPRGPNLVRYIVLHDTEGATAAGAARYFTTPASGGSANLVVDDLLCFRTLDDLVIPWGAPPLNTNGFHIEQAGFAAWTRAEWLEHKPTIQRAAYKAALRCQRFKIPARVLNVAQLRADFAKHEPAGGIVTHLTVSAAFGESDHTDPGHGYPMDVFLAELEGYLT
jgi:N-acetylmuramoyl-L-alanine amidase